MSAKDKCSKCGHAEHSGKVCLENVADLGAAWGSEPGPCGCYVDKAGKKEWRDIFEGRDV